jgi:septal ring factor EnvC (AmiA/AmiB activator)
LKRGHRDRRRRTVRALSPALFPALLSALLSGLLRVALAGPAGPAPNHAPVPAPGTTPAASTSAPAASASATPSARRQRELQAEQRELKAKLAQLKKSLALKESAHSEAADALAASESAISAANRHLQQLATTRRQVEQRIAQLHASERDAAAAQDAHATRLATALREQWLLAQRPDMAAALDPGQAASDARDGAYLDYVVRERLRRIGQLHEQRTEIAAMAAELAQRGAELDRIDADARNSRAQLLKQEAARKATLARLARDIAAQRQSVASLERDDTRLATLIDQIGKLLADQARHRAATRPRPPKETGAGRPEQRPPVEAPVEPPEASRFARLRGKLVLPVQGQIGSRYGAARLGEDGQPQAGAPAWKGLFIRAPSGSPVHAVAAGRVVFADWLRGFGNLIILDHGEGFLSVYADNETLLRSVGDEVAADEVIASVGNTGGNPQSGLYFEMRYQGRPFDPLAWAVAR